MAFDSKTLSPQARQAYIETGRQFGSSDTLAQADQTLAALAAYGSKLSTFSAADKTRLSEVRDLLVEAINDRKGAQGTIKLTNKAYVDAIAAGKVAWLTGRTVLQNSRSDLWESSDPQAAKALRALDTALEQTHAASKDSERLAGQLDILLEVLGEDAEGNPRNLFIAKVAGERGGAEVAQDLAAQVVVLRELTRQSKPQSTPTETEEMDLLDGIIVSLTRKARKAAREADKRAGTRALSKEFELNKLYQSTGKKKPAAGDEKAPEGAPSEAPPESK